ncbi:hypothetical protein P171DRAFT_235079 [Karstenula rhodostoma CBS 690.94]|uniref:Uncharacterized protein n=1 Tax=Karstenula rhodostoma CBS 690.94 TaxID=1392251 RepID=A0A9P4PPN6_9PLEO|nr:hypothetical protein P171DRAFT_235079 [Karstenula rhodostoma CBS 690.94]
MQAGMEQAAPKIAQTLWEKGHFVLSTPPARMRAPDALLRSPQGGIGIDSFPPRTTIAHQRVTTPLRSPVAESRIWEPLSRRVQSLTFDRYSAGPPSYSDAVAQQPLVGTGQARSQPRTGPAYRQLAPPSPPNSDGHNASTDVPVKIQSNTMRVWNNPYSMRHEKVKINVTAMMMSSGKYSISIECNGRYIDGGLVGRNVAIETRLSTDMTDRARSDQ